MVIEGPITKTRLERSQHTDIVVWDDDLDIRIRATPARTIESEEWITLDHWIYLSDKDPYCYLEVEYNTWWFTSDDRKEHCIREMHAKGCFLVNYNDETHIKFAVTSNRLTCLGLKGTRRELKEGRNGWKRVYGLKSNQVTLHGRVFAVQDGKNAARVHHAYKILSLWANESGIFNVELKNKHRAWIKPSWLIIERRASLFAIGANLKLYDYSPVTTHLYSGPIMKGSCSTILSIGTVVTIMGEDYIGSRSRKQAVQLGCVDTICDCPYYESLQLMDSQPENEIIINEVKPWYLELLDSVVGMLSDLLTFVVNYVGGPNWQAEIAIGLIVYLVGIRLSGSAIVAGALTAISFVYIRK